MTHGEARKAIDELNAELERIPKETTKLEGLLEQTRDSLEDLTPEAVKDLIENLRKEAAELEVEHPRATALMNQVMHALSGLGI
jgi:5-bromo-4-chloroindolyl phosphate hydrolysis protein